MSTQKKGNGQVVLAERYRLEEQVAAGGMGEVWRATDLLLERPVAVKLLRESLAEDPVVSERFRREALTAANLTHPNMADVFDYVQNNGRPGIVMEFVDGETLADRIERDAPLGVDDAVRITCALLAVLEVAHDAGVVHRDVKPGNVMLTPSGDIKVTDFGIARAVGHDTITETGMVVGTAHYLAPEQVTGKPATPSSDLYAAGAMLYEMLTGAKPFEAETPLAVAMRRLAEDPQMPREHRADIPPDVEAVIVRAMARDPIDRFPSAGAMREALTATQTPAAQTAPAASTVRRDPTPTQVLPAVDPDATAVRPAVEAAVQEPASRAVKVSRRRKRDYRRGAVWLIGTAGIVTLATVLVMALTGGPDLAPVPNFVGRDIAAAKVAAAELGLRIREVPRSSEEPKGEVLGQSIDAGTTVGEGALIRLAVSTGVPACCRVPDLGGLKSEDAARALIKANLRLGSVGRRTTSDAEPGTVVAQSPNAGEVIREGLSVDIVVAQEPAGKRGKGNGKGSGD